MACSSMRERTGKARLARAVTTSCVKTGVAVFCLALCSVFSGCGVETATVAASAAAAKQKELEQAQKTMEQMKQQIDQAMQQSQRPVDEVIEKKD